MHRAPVAIRTILAFAVIMTLAGCGTQAVAGSPAAAGSTPEVDDAALNSPSTISATDSQSSSRRFAKLKIACTLLDSNDLQSLGLPTAVPGPSAESCDYGTLHSVHKASYLDLNSYVDTRDNFVAIAGANDASGSATPTTIDGISVLAGKKGNECTRSVQRKDGVFVRLTLGYPTTPQTCDTLSHVAIRAISRLPSSI
ncbi:MAG: DUF3558 domain-containing protein [Pseudonocardiaceae bacterium]|nr:MAG: DUF3558 domain-containing protein [Pseudonocardiaceae bacterium]